MPSTPWQWVLCPLAEYRFHAYILCHSAKGYAEVVGMVFYAENQ